MADYEKSLELENKCDSFMNVFQNGDKKTALEQEIELKYLV